MVLSEHYKAIIAETPQLQPKTSMFVGILFGIIVLLFAFALFIPMTR